MGSTHAHGCAKLANDPGIREKDPQVLDAMQMNFGKQNNLTMSNYLIQDGEDANWLAGYYNEYVHSRQLLDFPCPTSLPSEIGKARRCH